MNYAGSSQCSFEAEELTSNKDKLSIGRKQVTNNERKRLTNNKKANELTSRLLNKSNIQFNIKLDGQTERKFTIIDNY